MKEIYGIKKVERNGETKSYWTRLGVAHECKDGSLNCYFDYLPVAPGIGINIREKKEREEKGENHDEGNGTAF